MGAVYVAEQLSTGKSRALKVMHPGLVSDVRLRERFSQEARFGAQIESEHVVEVVGAGVDTATGTPWLAMELLEGEDLARMLARRGPLPPEEARELLAQLCDGLGAAHARGVVHRDLKPENLYVAVSRRRGVPFTLKILDYGVARQVSLGVTTAGTMAVGTPLWMAPEQSDGRSVSPATDVWALGLLAFQVLTGKVYWRAANREGMDLGTLLYEVLGGDMDPASRRAAEIGFTSRLPAGFDPWFARCTAREPKARFQNGAEAGAWLPAAFDVVAAPGMMAPTPVALAASASPVAMAPAPIASVAPAPIASVAVAPASLASAAVAQGRTVAMDWTPGMPVGVPAVPAGLPMGAPVVRGQPVPMMQPGVPLGMPPLGGAPFAPRPAPPRKSARVWPWLLVPAALLAATCVGGFALVATGVWNITATADAGTDRDAAPSEATSQPEPQPEPQPQSAGGAPVEGESWNWADNATAAWQGTWTDGDARWAFAMTLRRQDDQVDGVIQWTLTAPGSAGRGAPGDTGHESVRGRYHPRHRTLELAGYQVDNAALLGLGEYRLNVESNGALAGHSRGNGDWSPQMEGSVAAVPEGAGVPPGG